MIHSLYQNETMAKKETPWHQWIHHRCPPGTHSWRAFVLAQTDPDNPLKEEADLDAIRRPGKLNDNTTLIDAGMYGVAGTGAVYLV